MKKEILFSLLISITVLISCTAKNYFIDAEYHNQKIANGLLLIPKIHDLKIYQEEIVFNEVELDSIKNRFLSGIITKLNDEVLQVSTFKNVGNIEFKQQPKLEKRTYNLNEKETIEVSVPKDKIQSQTDGKVFILFFENSAIDLLKNERETSDPAKHYSVSTTPAGGVDLHSLKFYDNQFNFNTNYLLYDNSNAKVVKCGKVNAKYNYTEKTDFDNMVLNIINSTAKKIIKDSPFVN